MIAYIIITIKRQNLSVVTVSCQHSRKTFKIQGLIMNPFFKHFHFLDTGFDWVIYYIHIKNNKAVYL